MKNVSIYILGLVSLLFYLGLNLSTTDRINNIISKGYVGVNNIVGINSNDLYYITKELDRLEETYNTSICNALKQIGTVVEEENPSFNDLVTYIVNSQQIKGTFVTTDGVEQSLVGVTENDIALGKAARVDGNYIIGNGYNIQESYNQGFNDAYNDAYEEGYNEAKSKLVKTISGSIHFGEPDDSGDITTYITLPVFGYKTLIVTSSNYASGHRFICVSYSGGTKSVGQNGTMTIDVSKDTVVTISNSGSDYIVDGSYQLIP